VTAVLPEVNTSTAFCAAVDRDALDGAIKFIYALLSPRPQLPVLGGVLLTADDNGVTLSGFDYEVTTRQRLAGTGTGSALVSARLLKDMVAKLNKGELATFATIDGKLEVRTGRRTYKLPLLPLEDLPARPELPPAVAVLSAADFALLPKAAVAASRDDTLPALTCLCLDLAPGKLTASCTDRYRLTRLRLEAQTRETSRTLVKATTAMLVVKHLAKQGEVTIGVHRDETVPLMSFAAGGREVIVRTETNDFPRCESLIPDSHDAMLEIEGKALLNGIDGASAVLSRNQAIRIVLNVVGATLEAKGHDDGAEISEYLGGLFNGEPMTVCYNPAYLADAVKVIGDTVQLHVTNPTRPALLTGPDGHAGQFVYLLMPVRIAS
jgi:DNA polymerase-3 subunit beta